MSTTLGNNPAAGTTNHGAPQTSVPSGIVPPALTAKDVSQEQANEIDARLKSNLRTFDNSYQEMSLTVSLARANEVHLLLTHSVTGKPFKSFTAYLDDRAASFPNLGKHLSKALVADMIKAGDSVRSAAAAAKVSVGTAAAIRKEIKEAEASKAEAEALAALRKADPAAAKAAEAEAEAKATKAKAEAEAAAQAKAVQIHTDTARRTVGLVGKLTVEQLATVLAEAKATVAAAESEAKHRLAAIAKAEAAAKAKAEAEAKAKAAKAAKAKPAAPAAPAAPLLTARANAS